MNDKKFDLEHQYQLYLQRVGLSESIMHEVQKIETRRAFMGACGQLIALLRDDVSNLDEATGVAVLEDMFNQVLKYFTLSDRSN